MHRAFGQAAFCRLQLQLTHGVVAWRILAGSYIITMIGIFAGVIALRRLPSDSSVVSAIQWASCESLQAMKGLSCISAMGFAFCVGSSFVAFNLAICWFFHRPAFGLMMLLLGMISLLCGRAILLRAISTMEERLDSQRKQNELV